MRYYERMTHTETPNTEPHEYATPIATAELDGIFATYGGVTATANGWTFDLREHEIDRTPVHSPSDRELIDALAVRVDALEQAQLPTEPAVENDAQAKLDDVLALLASRAEYAREMCVVAVDNGHDARAERWRTRYNHAKETLYRARRIVGRHEA